MKQMEEIIKYKIGDFEGPLDLLLQLISRNKMNIYDIPLTELTNQYLEQIEYYQNNEIDLKSEFLEMASRLLYIKTVSLLPKHDDIVKLKEELTGELLEYMVCQQMARQFSQMQAGFDRFVRLPSECEVDRSYELIHSSNEIYLAYIAAFGKDKRKLPSPTAPFARIVARKIVAVSTKIIFVIRKLWVGGPKRLDSLYKTANSRSELVATFLAVLELCKGNRVRIDGEGSETKISLIKEHKNK